MGTALKRSSGLEVQNASPVACFALLLLFSLKAYFVVSPIWTYGIQLWGTASTSNIEILERFQSKAFRMIVNAPWYVPNTVI
jgi:hypothetical protein